MKTKKYLKLVNDERKNGMVLSATACIISTDYCPENNDFAGGCFFAYDYCGGKDYTVCAFGNVDYCAGIDK